MIRDVTEATFEQDVIQRSHEVPVLVDFWAAWCGPCRQLTPALESAVREREPEVDLAKLDTDANQRIAAAFRIQGIPAVKAFRDGRVVDEFVGAQPPAQVARFLDGLLPSEADALVAAGGEPELRRAIELEPNRADARVALARLLHERGEDDAALELLANTTGSYSAEGLAARIRLEDDPELADAFAALDAGEQQGVLDELGAEHPLARESRRKLASALY